MIAEKDCTTSPKRLSTAARMFGASVASLELNFPGE
jgi:hypothetical protein